jgi:hypothetical protein
MGASECSQVVTRTARFNRHSFIGELQAAHCGPWFCVSSMRAASGWRSEFASKPTGCLRCEWVGRNDVDLNVIAFGAFEQPVFEADWPR